MADSPRIEELKRRVQSDPASIAFAALAEEYRRGQRFEEAIETCTAGLIRHPSYLSAHVTLGRALIEVGRLEDARNELEYVSDLRRKISQPFAVLPRYMTGLAKDLTSRITVRRIRPTSLLLRK